MGKLDMEEVCLSSCPQHGPTSCIPLSSAPVYPAGPVPEGWILWAGCVEQKKSMIII